jgi:hypothetical protein
MPAKGWRSLKRGVQMEGFRRPRYRNTLLLIVLVLVAACGSQRAADPTAATSGSQAPSSSGTLTPSTNTGSVTTVAPGPPTDAPGVAAAQSGCTDSGAASSPGPSRIAAKSANDDTFVITFDQGTPQFQVFTQTNARFIADPSGAKVLLPGTAGIRIVLRGLTFPADPTGPSSFTPHGRLVREIRRIGDFEGVVTWAVGLNAPGCASVTASGSTLTFRFISVFGKG